MKDALFTPTPEQIAERQKPYSDDLARWPDMAQLPEPEERQSGGLAGFVVWAACLSLVLGWVAWEAWF